MCALSSLAIYFRIQDYLSPSGAKNHVEMLDVNSFLKIERCS
jgi:hypothetical protein